MISEKLGIKIFLFLACFTVSVAQDVSEYEKRLEKLTSEIKTIQNKIQEEEKKKSSILSTLGKLGFQKKLLQNELSLYTEQLKKANSELISIQKDIPTLEAKLDEGKSTIEKILVTLYKFGKLNYVEIILKTDSVGHLLTENRYLVILAEHQQTIIADYLKTLNELKTSRERHTSKKEEIDQLIRKTREKEKELDIQTERNRKSIREITQNRNTYLKALEELEVRAEQLQKLIKKLAEKKIDLPFPLTPLYEKKGELIWPISGEVITHFGNTRHPTFKTITRNNGIEVAPQNNRIVKSIHPGTVVYADYFQGYGNLIIIDHGMAYYSLYGHCSEFLVKKNDIVNEGHSIAIVGDIGSFKGTTLYFEIRHQTEPVNPLQWLKKR